MLFFVQKPTLHCVFDGSKQDPWPFQEIKINVNPCLYGLSQDLSSFFMIPCILTSVIPDIDGEQKASASAGR